MLNLIITSVGVFILIFCILFVLKYVLIFVNRLREDDPKEVDLTDKEVLFIRLAMTYILTFLWLVIF